MDKNDIIEYVMHTPHNTNRAVLSSMLNQLAEGGGGSSDFSTAEVTIINDTNNPSGIDAACAFFEANECFEGSPEGIYAGIFVPSNTTVVFNVPLYKGKAIWTNYSPDYYSGDITIEEYGTVITGNCTITFMR